MCQKSCFCNTAPRSDLGRQSSSIRCQYHLVVDLCPSLSSTVSKCLLQPCWYVWCFSNSRQLKSLQRSLKVRAPYTRMFIYIKGTDFNISHIHNFILLDSYSSNSGTGTKTRHLGSRNRHPRNKFTTLQPTILSQMS